MSVKIAAKQLLLNTKHGNQNGIELDLRAFKEALFIMRTLNNTLRQRILKLIDGKGKTTVTKLYTELDVDQSTASQHLAELRKARAVKATRQGRFIFYTIDVAGLKKIISFVNKLLKA